MTSDCGHLLCERIGGSCSLATGRSRGCRPGFTLATIGSEVFDEVRELLAQIDANDDARGHAAAVRLAQIIRREAREDRQLLAIARSDEPELVPALERLCLRR